MIRKVTIISYKRLANVSEHVLGDGLKRLVGLGFVRVGFGTIM